MRSQAALHLENSPLVFVLGQVKIAPILKMPDYLPEIQEGLRKIGFPGYECRTTQEIVFGPVNQQLQTERWFFTNRDKTRSVILARDFVILATSVYENFEEFVTTFGTALEILKEICSPEFSSRLGLRYVDLIRPAAGESIDTYLQPGIRGLPPADLGVSSILHQMQFRAQTPVGVLSVRLWQNRDGRVLPPDIAGDEVAFRVNLLPHSDEQSNELLTILDIDHFSEDQRDYDTEALILDMWSLHDGTDRAFRSVVTPEAMALWGNSTLPKS